MKRTALVTIVFLLLLSACDNAVGPDGRVRLTGRSDFILGYLTPNPSANEPLEVFVGSIAPSGILPPHPPIGGNKELNRQIFGYRHRYRALISGRTDAEVKIFDEGGNEVALRSVGNGFYQNPGAQFEVRHDARYTLQVRVGGRTYVATTRIPGPFSITNIQDGEMIRAQRATAGLHRGHFAVSERWSPSQGSAFYRAIGKDSNMDAESRGYAIGVRETSNFIAFHAGYQRPAVDTVHCTLQVIAVDSCFARGYEIGGDYPDHRFLISEAGWLDDFHLPRSNYMPIRERSNITGSPNVLGVFGSYAQARVSYSVIRGEP